MRRFALLLVPALTVLTGCPIYDDDYYGDDYCDYDSNGNYDCNGYGSSGYTGSSSGYGGRNCTDPSDCFVGETCSAAGYCTSSSCSNVGCSDGYECVLRNGQATCVSDQTGSSSSGGSSSGTVPDGGTSQCQTAADCDVPGSKCLNNECIPPDQQCVDSTQCNAGARCANGVCTAECAADIDCPIGYACDETHGLCTENPTPCSEQTPCPTGATCVGDRCVQECASDDMCPKGLVCRLGGCVVDEVPSFVCAVTGEQGDGTPGKCATGSICLRGSCYISCDSDASNSCVQADEFNVCKPVTTGGETYSVCGTDDNLGTECDVANNVLCPQSTDVCVDGYCL